jgi:ergothioneine biosynthesis protein EgtB
MNGLSAFRAVREQTEALVAPLETEDVGLQVALHSSPPKWHLGHTTWFFETFLLVPHAPNYKIFHPKFSFVFNSYYEMVGKRQDRAKRGDLSRPLLRDVLAYREHVTNAVSELLATSDTPRIADIVALGCNHEQQHQELILTDILANFAVNIMDPAYGPLAPASDHAAPALTWHDFDGGIQQIGHDGPGLSATGFAFDNETPRHDVLIRPFSLSNRLITNGEFLEFIQAGGYGDYRWWMYDGWHWVKKHGIEHPLYWRPDGAGGYSQFTLGGLRAVDLNEPVCHVSWYEAMAFALWRGARLPTEAEWEVAFGDRPVTAEHNLADSKRYAPTVATGTGLTQAIGDVWEWTQSSYAPYPGYHAPEGAFGEYNSKFMASQLVLKGGSCATPLSHLRTTYRNFFYPAERWQFKGFRLAKDR